MKIMKTLANAATTGEQSMSICKLPIYVDVTN
jgi:hypothetical protein